VACCVFWWQPRYVDPFFPGSIYGESGRGGLLTHWWSNASTYLMLVVLLLFLLIA
jgi:hypothetical protein